MTALVGGDSKGKVSAVAGAVCRLPSFQPHNAGGEDLGDLIKALGSGHTVWIEGVGQRRISLSRDNPEDSAHDDKHNHVS
ncbi:MAG: hypothetical protein P9C48_09995 [Defluviicoccus sp.]|nr:hypothetical protein [Defluviicoccus sp.]MDG4591767.1 hypothetical protein [Defluviicoccus sp.]MDG4602536.1 hypothetical protein [Defluviicoccus sp.]MDG4609447.1 hypothetical protein [Defluviicoccus sp.]